MFLFDHLIGILTKPVNILIPVVPPLRIYYSFNTEWISLATEQKYVGLQLSEIGSATVASPVSELTLAQLTEEKHWLPIF